MFLAEAGTSFSFLTMFDAITTEAVDPFNLIFEDLREEKNCIGETAENFR